MTRTALITEFSENELPTGVAARVRHLRRAAGAIGDVEVIPLNSEPKTQSSLIRRLRSARRAHLVDTSGFDQVVAVGLGSPPMYIAARRLARSRQDVWLDCCDSTVRQVAERLRARSPKLITVGIWALAVQILSPRLSVSYISEADREGDKRINAGRATRVIGPSVPRAIEGLAPVEAPFDRIVLAGDFNSFHNRAGLDLLLSSYRAAIRKPPLELYGPHAPGPGPLPPGVTYMGWARDVLQIYEGQTVVFISNLRGTGVPNKLLEAQAAGRPVIVNETWATFLSPTTNRFVFSDGATLTDVIERIGSQS